MWAVMQLLWGSRSVCPLVSQASRSFSLGCSNLARNVVPKPKNTDRWTEKRSLFGVYDNIGILSDFKAHPRQLIIGPSWLQGWKGNELQRCIRKRMAIGNKMFYDDRYKLEKRIGYLYKRFNRYGKHR